MQKITLTQPDDWHCHLRDDDFLERTVPDQSKQFARSIVMPNLSPPITTVKQAATYRDRILKHIPDTATFSPLMTLYLTEATTPQDIREAASSEFVYACKYYPAGATTNSEAGVSSMNTLYSVFEAMESAGIPLLIHGETTNPSDDIFDREARFIDQFLTQLVTDFPALPVVLEHITTRQAVHFINESRNGVAATITAHHLLFDRNQLFHKGINPHYYCLPILKRREHRDALLEAATSGSDKFFLGTDSAPHLRTKKESSCGCAGIYTAHAAMPFYATAFEQMNALDKLETFASINGANFYNLPLNQQKMTLVKSPWTVPDTLSFGEQTLIPLMAGEILNWQVSHA